MPENFMKVVIAVGVLIAVSAILTAGVEWLFSNPLVLLFIALAIGGGIYLWQRQRRARNRV